MPASTFVMRQKEAEELWKRFKAWVEKNPKGSILKYPFGDQKVTESRCTTDRLGTANYRQKCSVELQDEKTGGLANFDVSWSGLNPYGEFEMVDADYPYPLEFDIAKKEFGIHWTPRTAQCFEMSDMRYCPAIQVVGGGLAAQVKKK